MIAEVCGYGERCQPRMMDAVLYAGVFAVTLGVLFGALSAWVSNVADGDMRENVVWSLVGFVVGVIVGVSVSVLVYHAAWVDYVRASQ